MTWGEAIRLARLIAGDMTTQLAAALNGWPRPVSPEYMALYTLIGNDVLSKTERRARVTMLADPFAPPPKRYGTASLSIPQLRALLDRHRQQEGSTDG